ncbi:MAG: electron transfer flavoprotein subunit alpha/FixB family protein [Syntrophomonas sp.]
MAGILIYSDKDQLALEMITAAQQIGRDFKAVTLNNDMQAQALAAAGADTYKINNPEIVQADVAAVAAALQQAADKLDSDIILMASNRRGKELAGRLAQITGAGCLTDVAGIKVEGNKIICQRNALGGATLATQYIAVQRQVIAVMPRTFEPAGAGSGKISELEVAVRSSGVKIVELKAKNSDSVDIEAASILVAVGEGLNSQADLAMVETLARKLGGVIACSKPVATDKKWLSEDRIIGLSGKKCKPELAILLGISGQVQFTVGIRDAKTIVAVNIDENAPINQMADYILNADLHEVAAGLNNALA